ncbi:hypothetical protein GOP47_0025152 [Adiantum capillus-veneris]|uniref:Methyltransferase type 11 domain-containing protein n=1 Tax=Adiantum capillus-veneris TaxID=13818 RepID=A0A9D4U454_ADICA|nr:hypothetical protein GOP47_0025152 [Adiantum capillus-veneris]
MGAQLPEDAVEHEPLRLHVSATGGQAHGRILRIVIYGIVTFFVIFASYLAFIGLIGGKHEDQSLQKRGFVSVGYLTFLPGYANDTKTPDWACLCEAVQDHLTSWHHTINEFSLAHANVHRLASYMSGMVNFYRFTSQSFKQHQAVDGLLTPKNVGMPSLGMHISRPKSAASTSFAAGLERMMFRRSQFLLRVKLVSFIKIMHELSGEGLLQSQQRILCLDIDAGRKVRALKKRGFKNVERIDVSPDGMVSNQEVGNALVELEDQGFDFAFTSSFDQVSEPALFVAEIERILKVGGFAAMHVSLNAWRSKYISKPGKSVKPVTLLFQNSKIVYVSAAYAPGLDTIIVFKKVSHIGEMRHIAKAKGAEQADIDEKHVSGPIFPSQLAVDFTGSLAKYECRKCIKEQDAMFAPNAMQ